MKKDDFAGKRILLDADVVSHFIKGQGWSFLIQLFKGQLYMLDNVESELMRNRDQSFTGQVSSLLSTEIQLMVFPTQNPMVVKEYQLLTLTRGDGEAACMAVARHFNDVIASSNLKDIRLYCQQHQIVYLTTMDLLLIAYNEQVMTEGDCDHFINLVLAQRSRLPCKTWKDYLAMIK
ncbi:hypothetical protein [Siphonobacter curvatus]|uniref:PIN domain-containing protein n=1 Tax=Siphonobacter curvatus TaxID=2094562 RepID=A0A2S7IHV1_9BACT|nr:hypothetical protein [Siphonobacter curvatus]PQA55660.1 hypothetical protein C5O19_19815 [Siphonobacter curvatus]